MFTEWVVLLHFCEQYLEGSALFMLIWCVSIRALYHQKFQNFSKYSSAQIQVHCAPCCVSFPLTFPQEPTATKTLRKIPNSTCQAKQTWMMCACCLLCATWVVLQLLVARVTVVPVNTFWHKGVSLISCPSKRLALVSPVQFAPRTIGKKRKSDGRLISQGTAIQSKIPK